MNVSSQDAQVNTILFHYTSKYIKSKTKHCRQFVLPVTNGQILQVLSQEKWNVSSLCAYPVREVLRLHELQLITAVWMLEGQAEQEGQPTTI